MRILLVTNDFPPRAGGIQQYCHNLVARLPADQVLVYAPAWPGASEFDAAQPFRVVRHPTSRMLPGREVERRAVALVRDFQPRVVVFGATFPLGLLAGRITRATGVPCVGWTHGVEVAVGRVPLVRGLMARVAGDLRLATAVSNWSAERVRRAVRGRCPVEWLVSGVDADAYHPGVDGRPVRDRHRLGDAPVCVCVSRLVPSSAWPSVETRRYNAARTVPVAGGARLTIAGLLLAVVARLPRAVASGAGVPFSRRGALVVVGMAIEVADGSPADVQKTGGPSGRAISGIARHWETA